MIRIQVQVSDPVACPKCEGKGTMLAFGIVYAPGHDGPWARELPCSQCKGEKVVPAEMLKWIERGQSLREYREGLRIGPLEAARLWDMKPSELSYLEQGLVDNTNWQPPAACSKET